MAKFKASLRFIVCVTACASLMVGCSSEPSVYASVFREETAQGADNAEAHYAALTPYLEQIQASLPASSYTSNDLLPHPASVRQPPEWESMEPLRIKFPIGIRNENYAPWLLARDLGYFTEAGLDVELLPSNRKEDIYIALDERAFDILIEPGGGRLIQKVSQGLSISAVSALYSANPFVFFTLDTATPQDQASSASLTPKAFPGSIVGIFNGHNHTPGILRDRWGIDPLRVKYIQWHSPQPLSLIEGRVSYLECELGFLTAEMEQKSFKNWVSFSAEAYITPESSWLSVVHNDLLESGNDVLERYNWALTKATVYLLDQPQKALPTLRQSIHPKRSQKWLSTAWNTRKPYIIGNPRIRLLSINQGSMDWAAAALLQQGMVALEN